MCDKEQRTERIYLCLRAEYLCFRGCVCLLLVGFSSVLYGIAFKGMHEKSFA